MHAYVRFFKFTVQQSGRPVWDDLMSLMMKPEREETEPQGIYQAAANIILWPYVDCPILFLFSIFLTSSYLTR